MRTRSHTLAPLALTLVLLTGCATMAGTPGKTTPTMTNDPAQAQQNRTRVIELFDATKKLIGGTWTLGGEGYNDCHLPSGETGAEYIRQEGIRPGPTDLEGTAKKVAALWTSTGFEGVVVSQDPKGNPEVTYPKDENRVYLSYSASRYGGAFQATGGCIPGDAASLEEALVDD